MSHLRMTPEAFTELQERNRKAIMAASKPVRDTPPKGACAQTPRRPGTAEGAVPAGKKRSHLEIKFQHQLMLSGLPMPVEEFYPLADRNFRIDFAYPEQKLAIEIDGAVHRIKGRFHSDLEKHALLLLAGWRVLRVGSEQIKSGIAMGWIKELLG